MGPLDKLIADQELEARRYDYDTQVRNAILKSGGKLDLASDRNFARFEARIGAGFWGDLPAAFTATRILEDLVR